jgi:hypothetical protein
MILLNRARLVYLWLSRLLVLNRTLRLIVLMVLLLRRRRGVLLHLGGSLFVRFVLLLLRSAALMRRTALSLDSLGRPLLVVILLSDGYAGSNCQAEDRTAGNALKHGHSDHSSATGNYDGLTVL